MWSGAYEPGVRGANTPKFRQNGEENSSKARTKKSEQKIAKKIFMSPLTKNVPIRPRIWRYRRSCRAACPNTSPISRQERYAIQQLWASLTSWQLRQSSVLLQNVDIRLQLILPPRTSAHQKQNYCSSSCTGDLRTNSNSARKDTKSPSILSRYTETCPYRRCIELSPCCLSWLFMTMN